MTRDPYEEGIRALAAESEMRGDAAARMERELLQAFAEHHRSAQAIAHARPRLRWRPWLAAAAAVAMAVGAAGTWRAGRSAAENKAALTVQTPPAEAPPRVAHSTPNAAGPPAAGKAIDRGSPGAVRARPARPVRIVQPTGFVSLPWSAGLPQFESGTIVRIQVPVASLPGYGVDISSGDGDEAVEADLLVGQDGQARAIRVVTNRSRSGQ